MADNTIEYINAPTREEMSDLGFSLRVQNYLEDIDKFNTDSISDMDSTLSLSVSNRAIIGQLTSEIHKLKCKIDDIENGIY